MVIHPDQSKKVRTPYFTIPDLCILWLSWSSDSRMHIDFYALGCGWFLYITDLITNAEPESCAMY